jgi:hypothetical protein
MGDAFLSRDVGTEQFGQSLGLPGMMVDGGDTATGAGLEGSKFQVPGSKFIEFLFVVFSGGETRSPLSKH